MTGDYKNDFAKVGKWGDVLWGLDKKGLLYLNEGRAAGTEGSVSPWDEIRNEITEVATIGSVTFPNGTSLSGLFKSCKNLVKADLSGFVTDNIIDMSEMFSGCGKLKELDLTSFDTRRCSDMSRMFANCASLTSILMSDTFSVNGDGSTSCEKLAIKEENKYRRARIIEVDGFKVRYHSGDSNRTLIEKQTVPNTRYTIEECLFEPAEESARFMGWQVGNSRKGDLIKPGLRLRQVDEDIDLYAVWASTPKLGAIKEIPPFVFGEKIPFEIPEIESDNDPEVTGHLEISPSGEEGTWTAISHDAILPVSCSGYLLRFHASNSIGETVSEPVRIHIKRANIDVSSVRWAEPDDMVYDGTPKKVWVEGLPAGIEPVYTGNEAVEAGTYTAGFNFDFDQDNFNEPLVVREHKWTIKKASFDMSQVRWNYEGAFGYTGSEYGVELLGLPEGVTAEYENNVASKAGVYSAIAKLKYDDINFEKPADIMPCVWEIKRKEIDPSDLTWSSYEDFKYDGSEKSVYITNLGEDVQVEYTGASETLAGKYLARAKVSGNYVLTGPAEYEWEIRKADFDMAAVHWSEEKEFTYDGSTHRVELLGLPEGLDVRYSGNEGANSGMYKAWASFINPDTHNYVTPDDMTHMWEIVKKEVDMSEVRWNYSGPFTYDGENKRVELTGLPEGVGVEYSGNSGLNAGIYNAQATLVYDEENLHAERPLDCRWRINKKRIDISDVKWSYDNAFTYDGNEHFVYLENLPEGVAAEYSGNSGVNAGKYVASAELVPNDIINYEAPKVSGCTWAINKSGLKLGDIKWTDSSDFVYDGREKMVEITGDLGPDVTAAYRGNKAVNAGRYYAKASFSAVDGDNFEAPQDIGYSWEINKADCDMSGVHWDYDASFVYDGSVKSVRLAGLPEGVKVSYRNASATDAGDYNAVAEFEVIDKDNYYDNIPEMILDWSIKKAVIDMSDVSWQETREFTYDGTEKFMRLTGLPEGVEPVYSDNSARTAGSYTAKADFKFDEKNYERPEVAPCHWVIDKSDVDTSAVRWEYDQPFKYDGIEKSVALSGVPEDTEVRYTNASAVKAGTYIAAAELIPGDADNRNKKRFDNLTWRIEKGDYDMSHVRWDYEKPYTYDGTEHKVVLKGYPEGVTPIYRGNSASEAGKYRASVTFKIADKKNFNIPEFEELEWEIKKRDYEMSTAAWDYDGSIKYDGRMHEVVLRGLPEGLRAVYSGNAAADTGSYEAVAQLIPYDQDNYNTPVIDSCRWQITKADVDMTSVSWDYGAAKVYNGREQGVMLERLPSGVTASYSGNEATEVGKYTAKAVLSVTDAANYNTPAVSECDWEIIPAEIDLTDVKWESPEGLCYDGGSKSIELKGLPEIIEASYKGNIGTRAGDYTATATFTSSDANFRAPDPVTMPWRIEKADFDMRGVSWDYTSSFVYDGKPKKVQLADVPKGLKVTYVDNEKTDAGTYRAIAHFEAETGDFNAPEDMSCIWSVEKADADISKLRWDYSQAFTYDGRAKSVCLQGLSDVLKAEYTGNEAIDSGSYVAHADLVPLDPDNYNHAAISDCTWEIEKADYDMTDARWEGDFDAVYDGRVHKVLIEGLPEGVKAVYTQNEAEDAGDYVASAELMGDTANYNQPVIGDCRWKIRKASFDMSHVAWNEHNEFTFDGAAKSVELTGVPEGVTPVYSGQRASEVGEYEASVRFEYDERNYEKPEFGGCKWRINKAAIPVDTSSVHWNYNVPFVYDGTEKGIELNHTTHKAGFLGRLRGMKDEIRLDGIPEGFDVVYEGNTATEAGTYYATATLVSRDGSNYTSAELPKCKWEISKATVDMSGVSWNYEGAFTYDGEEKTIELQGLPENVNVTYSGNTASDAGSYEAMAEIEVADPDNYEQPGPVSGCWWQIEKAVYDMSEAHWVYDDDLIYTGKEMKVRIIGLPDGVRVGSYEGNAATEAGTYLAEAHLKYRDKNNYEEPVMPECRWRIEKKEIDLSEVRWDYDEGTLFVYDGKPKEVKLVGLPKDVEVVYVDSSKIGAGTYTARANLIYDTKNCEAREVPDLTWTIEKATYAVDDVHWTYEKPFEYDGKNKSISLCNLPSTIKVRYRDNKASATGTYTAKAYLTYDSDNYNEPDIDTTIDWSIVRKTEG